ncbi:SGNH/GDSL hydrolase family protein [Amycolatopsis sp. NPDC059021]|uniref:SGNH/GDSL hydrolase family protein n=1 Tax=Amycolatopsis sp. NPDC059021 TaxID=3346704 RepID=UPI00366FE5FD
MRGIRRLRGPAATVALLGLIAAFLTGPPGAADEDVAAAHGRGTWVGGWAAAMGPPGSTGISATGFADRTLRLVVHTSAGGGTVRIRLSNVYGTTPLDIGSAVVALRANGAATVPGTRRAVSFDGKPDLTIPPGAQATSDPVALRVAAGTDVVVSLYLPTPTGPTTWHGWANQTSYLSTAGNHAAEDAATAYPDTTTSAFFLAGLDVSATTATGTVVAFGDSITEGGATTKDANRRWPDVLARRLAAGPPRERLSVVNEGIGGNRVLTDAGFASGGRINLGVNALARFDRDALAQPGVRSVIVLEGTNDLGGGGHGVHPGSPLTAEQLIAGLHTLIREAHARRIAIFGGTITPNGKLDPANERIREQVNTWIRGSGAFDGVIDFDAALRDPADPHRLLPAYDSGDHVHPNDAGLRAMAGTVDIGRLSRPPRDE